MHCRNGRGRRRAQDGRSGRIPPARWTARCRSPVAPHDRDKTENGLQEWRRAVLYTPAHRGQENRRCSATRAIPPSFSFAPASWRCGYIRWWSGWKGTGRLRQWTLVFLLGETVEVREDWVIGRAEVGEICRAPDAEILIQLGQQNADCIQLRVGEVLVAIPSALQFFLRCAPVTGPTDCSLRQETTQFRLLRPL